MDKQNVLRVYLESLDKKIEEVAGNLQSIYSNIDAAPTPSESHSDTTRSQLSQVALGISERLSSLKTTRAMTSSSSSSRLIRPTIGALIEVEDNRTKEKVYYFVVHGVGGESLLLDGSKVFSVSINAPILNPISKIKIGDTFEFRGRRLTLTEIS